MKANVGSIDRVIRILLGVIGFAVAYFAEIYLLAIPAGIVLLSGLFSFCPLYVAFGVSTCKLRHDAPRTETL